MGSRKYLILAALGCVALACVLIGAEQKIRAQEGTIETLRAALDEEERELKAARSRSPVEIRPEAPVRRKDDEIRGAQTAPAAAANSYEILKGLESAEELQQLLADNPTDETAAIASRFIFEKATDEQALPDDALQAIYASQTNPDLKRVVAQVLSQRGDNALLANQIAEAQATLKSATPRDRLDALSQLGKIHSVHAVDAIAPALQDSDSTVRLAALFALRDNGNQRHVGLVEPLIHDPDPSVSTLAANVISALKNYSSTARTSYSRSDIEAELPPIANP